MVALVITTIVLLILAGVVVKLSIGDNGVVSRTKDAANKYDASQSYEIGLFNDIANEYDQIVSGNWSIGGSGNNPGGGNQGGR